MYSRRFVLASLATSALLASLDTQTMTSFCRSAALAFPAGDAVGSSIEFAAFNSVTFAHSSFRRYWSTWSSKSHAAHGCLASISAPRPYLSARG